MKITELIRDILDVIDDIEIKEHPGPEAEVTITAQGDDINRFRQIVDLAQDSQSGYANQPNERIAGVDAVTVNAVGGMNGPKDPSDIRGSTQAMYPERVFGAR